MSEISKTNWEPPVPPIAPPDVKADHYPTNSFITNDLGAGEYTPSPVDVDTSIFTDNVTVSPTSETGGQNSAPEVTNDNLDTSSNSNVGDGIEGGNGDFGIGGDAANTSDIGFNR